MQSATDHSCFPKLVYYLLSTSQQIQYRQTRNTVHVFHQKDQALIPVAGKRPLQTSAATACCKANAKQHITLQYQCEQNLSCNTSVCVHATQRSEG